MNITSFNTMIFAKEIDGKIHYRAGLSRKNQKDEYERAYIDVRMPKDANIQDRTKINITSGFLSFYNYLDKEGKTRTIWYIVVQDYTMENKEKAKQEKQIDVYEQFGNKISVEQLDADTPDLELPF